MKIIAVKNTGLTFADRDLKNDFNIIDIPQLPFLNKWNNTLEALPDGSSRQVATVNMAMDFVITFAGETLNEEVKTTYLSLLNDGVQDVLTVFSLDDGVVLGSYKAVIKDFIGVGTITNGAGTNGSITFNLLPL